tara:strand:+ start:227 stop:367 length:141 start_codon:yes stop_codon:yes gene_type:complete
MQTEKFFTYNPDDTKEKKEANELKKTKNATYYRTNQNGDIVIMWNE